MAKGRFVDLSGRVFGKLTVLRRVPNAPGKHTRWACLCECGNNSVATGSNLASGHTTSCGCANASMSVKNGISHTPIYALLANIKDRCNNTHNKSYHNYGGRGIFVSPEWDNPLNFTKWAFENGYQKGLTLERKDNDGPYSPDNCKFATKKEQAQNRRTVKSMQLKIDTLESDLLAARNKNNDDGIQIARLLVEKKKWETRCLDAENNLTAMIDEALQKSKELDALAPEIKRQTIDRLYNEILAAGVEFPPAAREVFHRAMNELTASPTSNKDKQ